MDATFRFTSLRQEHDLAILINTPSCPRLADILRVGCGAAAEGGPSRQHLVDGAVTGIAFGYAAA
jgi:hypothetical protein